MRSEEGLDGESRIPLVSADGRIQPSRAAPASRLEHERPESPSFLLHLTSSMEHDVTSRTGGPV